MKAQAPNLVSSPQPSTDASASGLVRLAQRGDRQAFSQLYALYAPKVQAYVLRHVGGDVELAEDLTSDVFLKTIEHLDSYHFQDVPFSSWLYRIARNRVIDHYRRTANRQPVMLDEEPPPEHKSVSDASLILNRQVLNQALKRLTPEQRNVVVLRLVQGQSIAETARALGRTEDAVKQLQRRALGALERILQTPTLAPMP
ncbi:MAG TPA: sigma-70 family RNA polymerase sigma factor [Chloroflexota bacterium]